MSLFSDVDGTNYHAFVTPNFPGYRGWCPRAMHSCSVPTYPTPFNYCVMTLLNWVTPAYAARRGGLRRKYLRTGGSQDDIWYVVRSAELGLGHLHDANAMSSNTASIDVRAREAATFMQQTWDGAHATHIENNSALEVELPWYTNQRFTNAKDPAPSNLNDTSVDNPAISLAENETHQLCGTWTTSANAEPVTHAFVSTGEDFTLGFFLGCPVLYALNHTGLPATQ